MGNYQKTFLLALVCASTFLAGCGSKNSVKAESTKSDESVDPLKITPVPSLRERLSLGVPELQEVSDTYEVAGRIEADATRLARVGSPVRGRITDLLVLEGEHVRRGQPLATLYSTDLSDTQFGFIKAVSQQQLNERSAERGKQLLDADVIGTAELQRRQAEVLQANAEVAALRQQLDALGMTDAALKKLESTRKINSQYQVMASISGTVLDRSVTIGQIVQPAEIAFLIADLSNVWVIADVPEQAAGDVHIGKQVEAGLAAFPGEKIHGKLSFVGATVNPQTRTVRVRMDLGNPKGRYKPDMLATVTLEGRPMQRLTVPTTAVVREGDTDNIFVQVAPNTFVLRQVTLGMESGDRRVLMSGITKGEHVVLDGAFHLNNERKRLALGAGGAE